MEVKELLSEYNSKTGYIGKTLYHFLREVAPMSCADAVLVPEAERQGVILFYRDAHNCPANFSGPMTKEYW